MNKIFKYFFIVLVLALLSIVLFRPARNFFRTGLEYEKNNYVLNKSEKDYFLDIIHIGLNELGIKGATVVIEDGVRTEEYERTEIKAVVNNRGSMYLIRVFDIPTNEVLTVISHELIHILQFETGLLVEYPDRILYKGLVYDKDNLPPYLSRPWEVDAFYKEYYLRGDIKEKLK